MLRDAVILILGWLLGLLGGPISEWIRRSRRRKELIGAINAELRECRYLMASVAYLLKAQVGNVDRDFLDWLLPLEREEASITGDSTQLNAILQALSEASSAGQRPFSVNRVAEGINLSLKTYSLPLLESGVSDLVLLPLGYRREVLALREQLDLLNQDVPRLMELSNRTFDSALTGENRAVVVRNIERGYSTMGESAQDIANRISALLSAHSKR